MTYAQRKALKRLDEAGTKGCEYTDIVKVGANGKTLQVLTNIDPPLARMKKICGSKFWYITEDGRKSVREVWS
jgi:hypothetical protein